jgi:hypothetical protein
MSEKTLALSLIIIVAALALTVGLAIHVMP